MESKTKTKKDQKTFWVHFDFRYMRFDDTRMRKHEKRTTRYI